MISTQAQMQQQQQRHRKASFEYRPVPSTMIVVCRPCRKFYCRVRYVLLQTKLYNRMLKIEKRGTSRYVNVSVTSGGPGSSSASCGTGSTSLCRFVNGMDGCHRRRGLLLLHAEEEKEYHGICPPFWFQSEASTIRRRTRTGGTSMPAAAQ
jgi:hypothetical protein